MRKEPLPRGMQRELSDFYVQYTLLAHLEDGCGQSGCGGLRRRRAGAIYREIRQSISLCPPAKQPGAATDLPENSISKSFYGWAQSDTETYAVPSVVMGLDSTDEKYATQMQQLVLSVLNGSDYLKTSGHPKWRSSLMRTYFPNRGYEPTNQVIQIFNVLDRQGYRIVKK
jgi:hypothetical protein